jgi:hypothetical protein
VCPLGLFCQFLWIYYHYIEPGSFLYPHSLSLMVIILVTDLYVWDCSWTYRCQTWNWRQCVPTKRRYPPAKVHGAINQKTTVLRVTAVGTRKLVSLTQYLEFSFPLQEVNALNFITTFGIKFGLNIGYILHIKFGPYQYIIFQFIIYSVIIILYRPYSWKLVYKNLQLKQIVKSIEAPLADEYIMWCGRCHFKIV